MTTAPTAPVVPSKTASKRIYNFSAGPAVLPEEVLLQAREDLWSIAGSGIGILEHSHRGPVFDRVIDEAEADCRRIAGISDDYHVLFLQGGATLQFSMIPMNFLGKDQTADYPDTGVWTTKAIKEAKLFGNVNVAFEGSRHKYDHTPAADELNLSPSAVYLHYCSNNTIYGTRYNQPPTTAAPLVCDMSSDIFSRPVDVSRHALIYAGAQKNLGPAGATLVIIRKDLAERTAARKDLPTMMNYAKHADQGSRLNTPPSFGIYLMGQVFKWILKQGGLEALGRRNEQKAKLIYDVIDADGATSGFYRAVARPDCRSMMNVTFRTPSDALDKALLAESAKHDMDGLKGHRDAGGLRASIYNAFPVEGCEALAQLMRDFAARNG
jgi:phosphoserine aminotransferase